LNPQPSAYKAAALPLRHSGTPRAHRTGGRENQPPFRAAIEKYTEACSARSIRGGSVGGGEPSGPAVRCASVKPYRLGCAEGGPSPSPFKKDPRAPSPLEGARGVGTDGRPRHLPRHMARQYGVGRTRTTAWMSARWWTSSCSGSGWTRRKEIAAGSKSTVIFMPNNLGDRGGYRPAAEAANRAWTTRRGGRPASAGAAANGTRVTIGNARTPSPGWRVPRRQRPWDSSKV
jgi:hypothetical protein